ncbi:ATP-dependent RNA helicase [Sporobolomyces koalae]|uniref:ATP-dependent RNA helicase n=1 Tax=Sporobolomyces koalae TaxID=500713 RepID=UPI00317B41B2
MPSGQHFSALRAKKRKLGLSTAKESSTASSSKRKSEVKFRNATPATLDWKNIHLPGEFGFDEDGGLLELDEIDGVDVVYEDGRVQFKVKEDDTDSAPPAKKSKKAKGKEPEIVNDESPFPEEELFFAEEDVEQTAEPEKTVEAAQEPAAPIEKGKKAKKSKKRPLEVTKAPAETAQIVEDTPFDTEKFLPKWSHLALAPSLYRALHELNFDAPTAIQDRALALEEGSKAAPTAQTDETEDSETREDGADAQEEAADEGEWGGISNDAVGEDFQTPEAPPDRDVVGVAQTGSGKTYAYGLPILSHILRQATAVADRSNSPTPSEDSEDLDPYPPTRLAALILCPTRELALQVRASLFSVAVRTLPLLPPTEANSKLAEEDPRRRQKGKLVNIVALTGGMSVDKQKRQLEKGADIIVATPGRLWDLIGESDELVREIKGMKFLVIDEADRMIENGHFAELDNIVRLTKRKGVENEASFVDDFAGARVNTDLIPSREDMRTFVFSATMSKELQRNVKRKPGWKRWVPKGVDEDSMSSLDDLLDKLDFRDPNPEIIDLTPEHGLVETLKECKVECLVGEKDIYLYHFLLRYPARTIVFLASIDGIRRLNPLLDLLGLNVIPIHSGMQQRQRLKALDRFKSSPTAILLATDVAARGLDIPSVSHVVHYQLPRSADTYVHRSGRTARAGQTGLALQIVAPEEKNTQRMLMAGLGKSVDLPALPVDFSIFDQLKKRVELAKKIDAAQHRATKEAHDDKWLRDAAEAMEIDLDEDEYDFDNDSPQVRTKRERNKALAEARQLKSQLRDMLSKPLMMRGVSAKYLTGRNTVGLIDQLVTGTGHTQLLGMESSSALDDLAKPTQDPLEKRKKKKVEQFEKAKKAQKA